MLWSAVPSRATCHARIFRGAFAKARHAARTRRAGQQERSRQQSESSNPSPMVLNAISLASCVDMMIHNAETLFISRHFVCTDQLPCGRQTTGNFPASSLKNRVQTRRKRRAARFSASNFCGSGDAWRLCSSVIDLDIAVTFPGSHEPATAAIRRNVALATFCKPSHYFPPIF